MSTKFPRKVCFVCRKKKVLWKAIPVQKADGNIKAWMCWECAQRFFQALNEVEIKWSPYKSSMIKWLKERIPEDAK